MEVRTLAYPLQDRDSAWMQQPKIVAIGDFDGVHLGHQNVIHQALELGKQLGIRVAILTFDPHPREVLGQSRYARYLAPLPKKLEILQAMGLDDACVFRFDEQFARISPQAFVEEVLVPLHVHTVVVGFDFTFGHKGEGTVDTLRELCAGQMKVHVAKPFLQRGDKVSSTLIREQLQNGCLDLVKESLGRNYYITGKVIHGDGRGRTIGFPTANLSLTHAYVVPKRGVYAVKVTWKDQSYNGVMNIGVKPTFSADGEQVASVEVHVLDFSADLYGEELAVEFVQRLRDEVKFQSVQALVEQITRDAEQARQLL